MQTYLTLPSRSRDLLVAAAVVAWAAIAFARGDTHDRPVPQETPRPAVLGER